MFSNNRKPSSEFRSKHPTTPSPEYQIALSPLSISETNTTSTEFVTTTTTETTTPLFSLSYWRKRHVSQPTAPQIQSLEVPPRTPTTFQSSRLPSLDKALPPTPCSEGQGSRDVVNRISCRQPSPILQESSRSTNVDRGSRSTQTQMQTLLGLGIPKTSYSPRLETASTSTSTPPPPPPPPPPSPPTTHTLSSQLRKAKSTNRLRTPKNEVDGEHRRRRGLSFGAPSLLVTTTESHSKGKGKETEPSPILSKSSPKPLARKSSFWRKKASQATESPTTRKSHDDNVLILPPLPPVNVSPFVTEFALEPFPPVQNSKPLVVPPFPRSQSDNTGLRCSTPGSTTSSPKPSVDLSAPPPTNDALPVPQPRTPPLFHRLSFGVFASSDPSPSAIRPNLQSQSKTQLVSMSPIVSKPDTQIPKPLGENESPELYLSRLKSQVSRAEVASILASSSDAFYATTLKTYLNQFEFSGIALDVALRKLLMEVGLPRETQQIDRVVEAFAFRYRECNPNLFTSEDHPYILAFSLIMLHTDAFNPSNKRKMTKADYIKNTRLPGVPAEVLECFFDNIVFAPFIFIEVPEDTSGQPGLNHDLASAISPTSALPSANGTANFKTGNKVDPYYLIMNNLLDPLRVDINSYIPLENPFTFEGAHGPWNEVELHNAFLKANVFEMDVPSVNHQPAMFNLSPNSTDIPTMSLGRQAWQLNVTKVGLMNRKDDLAEGGKKTLNRKWKTWSVILTESQLLFCRDPTWASVLLSERSDQQPTVLSNTTFRPDEFFSLKDAVAVFDCSYKKYNHTFRFILSDGRHLLLQAANDEDLHQWISRINYASTFMTAGVRMRPAALSGEDVHLTGVAAATSHLHDMQRSASGQRPYSHFPIAPNELMDMLSGQPSKTLSVPRMSLSEDALDLMQGSPVSPASDGAEQFKATFNQVKADLASNPWSLQNDENTPLPEESIYESPPASPRSADSYNSRFPPRSQIILRKIRFLDAKIASLRSHLESEERFARHIAILTPFRKSTRTRLLGVIQNLTRPVMQVRLELEKLKCHRAVLHSDFVSETRSRNQTRRIALRAAKDILRPRRPSTAPPMSLSMLDDKRRTLSTRDSGHQSINTPLSLSTSSSRSFHSARESLCESSGGGENSVTTSPRLACRQPHASTSSSSLLDSSFDQDQDEGLPRTPFSSSPSTGWKHQNTQSNKDNNSDKGSHGDDDEQAEEWSKTRAAHRVSLIQVPCDIATSTRLRAVLEGSNDES